MSSEWKKILQQAEQLFEKIRNDPVYERATSSSEFAIGAIKSAVKKAQLAERGNVVEWYTGKVSPAYDFISYGLAKIIADNFQVEEPFNIDDFKKIPSDTLKHYIKLREVGISRKYYIPEKDDLRPKLDLLVKKGFLAKRRALAESGTIELEYKVTRKGYDILQEQGKASKKL